MRMRLISYLRGVKESLAFGVQASECFLPVDRGQKSIVLAALKSECPKMESLCPAQI